MRRLRREDASAVSGRGQRARSVWRRNRRLRGLSVALSVAAGGSPGRTDGRSLRRETGRRDDRENEPDLRRTSAGLCRNGARPRGDLIICKRTRPVLVLCERKSRVMLAARLVGKTASETISVMLAVFARIEPALRKSLTFDNDTAFAQHALLKTICATSSSPLISRRENASVSRRHFRRSSKSLAKTCKSGFHRPVAPRSRIHAP